MDQLQILAAKITPGDVGVPAVNADNVFVGGLSIVYFFAGVACVISIIAGGILYAISDGDSGKVKTAKNAILYAVVGLIVILIAFVLTGFIVGRFA